MERQNNLSAVKIRTLLIVLFVILLGLGSVYAWFFGKNMKPNPVEILISTFEECAAAGNPVMESYPRRCRTKDGREFTERVNIPDVPFQPSADSNLGGVCNNLCGDGVCQEIVCMGSGCPCVEAAESCQADCTAR